MNRQDAKDAKEGQRMQITKGMAHALSDLLLPSRSFLGVLGVLAVGFSGRKAP
jgi:hypothetical protein